MNYRRKDLKFKNDMTNVISNTLEWFYAWKKERIQLDDIFRMMHPKNWEKLKRIKIFIIFINDRE